MKKLLFSLFAIFGVVLSILAWTTSGRFLCTDGGKLRGQMNLYSDGTYNLTIDGKHRSGTYSIDRECNPGDSNIPVRFNSESGSFVGTIMWPTQEGVCIYVEGGLFRRISH